MHGAMSVVVACLTLAGSAAGAVIQLNPSSPGLEVTGTVMDARYRISNTNWDQMIATSSSISGATLVQTANLGTHNQLNARAYDFDLGYDPVAGWTWSLTNVSGGAKSLVSWTAPFNGASPFRSFNGLEIFAVAANLDPATIASGTSSITDFAFFAPGQTVGGSLVNLVTTWTGAGTGGLVRQFVVSDTDMSTFAWNIRGRLQMYFTYQGGVANTGNLDERLKFDIKAGTVIPAPASAALVLVGGLVAARRRR
jgi:hypothetical protein